MISVGWGATEGIAVLTCLNRAVAVPLGNPGVLRLELSGAGDASRRVVGGSYVSFTHLDTVSVTDTQTLNFSANLSAGAALTVSVYDATTGDFVGSWFATDTRTPE